MKKIVTTMMLCLFMIIASTQQSHAFIWVVVNAAVKKVIKAADLQIQRQQNKVIWLQNAQKVLENTLSETKLGEISDWTKKQKEQYKKYYEELQQVKTIISYYQRIKSIGQKQAGLLRAYQQAWALIRKDGHFSSDEIQYMGRVYNGILDESVENLDQIMLVINSFKTEMSDAKRMEIINTAADKIDQNYADLLQFNSQNAVLSLQRSKDAADVIMVKQLYGLK
ncbi:conjugal transfer protein TraI [Pedobacter sp. HMWF019]|uniref:conjugal transfer protein TraI n=1 Tax=Pedobacter sp. HMWF019 TaxID=2056856 RepID=UPI000D3829DE|nr:conjugal transfer protein TraI [Pedobacter sp. HMWF019]PTS99877.1 conjugal transfer protein TraI [Pedobacter sp. HMWF019]